MAKAIDREVTVRVLIGINPPEPALEPALKIIAEKATALVEAELRDLANHLMAAAEATDETRTSLSS